MEVLYDKYQVILQNGSLMYLYIYEDGSSQFDGNVDLNEYGTIQFQLVRKVKGTFDELFLNIGQFEDYEEW